MRRIPMGRVIAGAGFEDDRYALGKGAWSGVRDTIRHISLIESEAIELANSSLEVPFLAIETRRNILTKGIRLNDLVGQVFFVGEVQVRGVELCVPCARPSKLAGKPGFAEAFADRGGLRVETLSNGIIQEGDIVIV